VTDLILFPVRLLGVILGVAAMLVVAPIWIALDRLDP
jgi:hypothetical protein